MGVDRIRSRRLALALALSCHCVLIPACYSGMTVTEETQPPLVTDWVVGDSDGRFVTLTTRTLRPAIYEDRSGLNPYGCSQSGDCVRQVRDATVKTFVELREADGKVVAALRADLSDLDGWDLEAYHAGSARVLLARNLVPSGDGQAPSVHLFGPTGVELHLDLPPTQYARNAVSLSPDGQLLAVLLLDNLEIYAVDTGELIAEHEAPSRWHDEDDYRTLHVWTPDSGGVVMFNLTRTNDGPADMGFFPARPDAVAQYPTTCFVPQVPSPTADTCTPSACPVLFWETSENFAQGTFVDESSWYGGIEWTDELSSYPWYSCVRD